MVQDCNNSNKQRSPLHMTRLNHPLHTISPLFPDSFSSGYWPPLLCLLLLAATVQKADMELLVSEGGKKMHWLAARLCISDAKLVELPVVSGTRTSQTDSLAGRTFSQSQPSGVTQHEGGDGIPARQEFPSTLCRLGTVSVLKWITKNNYRNKNSFVLTSHEIYLLLSQEPATCPYPECAAHLKLCFCKMLFNFCTI